MRIIIKKIMAWLKNIVPGSDPDLGPKKFDPFSDPVVESKPIRTQDPDFFKEAIKPEPKPSPEPEPEPVPELPEPEPEPEPVPDLPLARLPGHGPEYDWRSEPYVTQKEIEDEKKTESELKPRPVLEPEPVDPATIEATIRENPATINSIKSALNNANVIGYQIHEAGKVGVNTKVFATAPGIRVPVEGYFKVFIAKDRQVEAGNKLASEQ